MTKLRAFTLIEISILVAIMAISITMILAWTLGALKRAELQSSTEALVGIIRNQQSAAFNSKDNASHGINLSGNQYIIFSGDDYASSPPESHQNFALPAKIQLQNFNLNGATNDLVFAQDSGTTDNYGDFSVTHTDISDTFTISINQLGLVDWY